MDERSRLDLINGILRQMTAGATLPQVISRTVDRLGEYFRTLRVAHVAVAEPTSASVTYSVQPEGMPDTTGVTIDLTAAPQYLSVLLLHRPVAVKDVVTDVRLPNLADSLTAAGTGALVHAPIFVRDDLVGILCLEANGLREWSEQEKVTLVDVAGCLSVAAQGAEGRTGIDSRNRELVTATTRLRTLIENLQAGVLLENETREILNANATFCEMFGIPRPEAVIGVDCALASEQSKVLFVDPGRFVSRINETLEQRHPVRNEELVLIDGRVFERDYVAVEVSALFVGNLWIYRDVTHTRRLQEQLLQSQKMEAIGLLAGGIAHDFNNLLTVILSYTQLGMRGEIEGEQLVHYLQEMFREGERAALLISQLLAFSRQQITEPRGVNLNDLIVSIDSLLRRLIGEDVELATLPSPDLAMVKIDPIQFQQVMVNLVVNARDAMPQGGRLIVQTTNITSDHEYARRLPSPQVGLYVAVEVTDTGTGMSAEVAARAFDPFFTTKDVGERSGLGLSTCYGIVSQSGGHISFDSQPGHGTTVRVLLPQASGPASEIQSREDLSGLPTGDETVFLVEDEPSVRRVVSQILRAHGYSVVHAANGVDALRLAEERSGERIHLLLTDVVLPLMGGSDLADQFSRHSPYQTAGVQGTRHPSRR